MSPIQQMLLGVGAVATKTYVDDVFSTFLYKGTEATQVINNGIDLSTEGGMVWAKGRNYTFDHRIFDTEQGTGKYIRSNESDDQETDGNSLTSFNTTGFTLGSSGAANMDPVEYSSWTFRKAPGFFDVVTYTGTAANRSIAHNLGSTPGMIFVKALGSNISWYVWHKSLGNGTDNQYEYALSLNSTSNETSGLSSIWYQNPTSTHFSVGTNGAGNASSISYVAYLFADNVTSFGEDGDASVIKCGKYIGNGSASAGTEINLGWEPQFLLCKKIDNPGGGASSSNWHILDSLRGTVSGGDDDFLMANIKNTETSLELADFTSTGFKNTSNRDSWNYNGDEYIYMAIRRSDGYVGKPPELGTDVFAMVAGTNSAPAFVSGFPVDFSLYRQPTASHNWHALARLMGSGSEHTYLRTNGTNAEVGGGSYKFDFMNGWLDSTGWDSTYQSWMWKRHAGFDVVCYTGDDVVGRQIPHSLNKTAEMIWIKNRDNSASNAHWRVYHKGINGGTNPADKYLILNTEDAEQDSAAYFNDTEPTSTNFTVGSHLSVNNDGDNFIAMLFASTDVSHVGYYSGNNSGQTITTGFQPRFIIIKSLSYNSWFVFDTVRGWSQNNQDWYLRLEGNYAQSDNVNDRPDDIGHPLSTGFYLKGDTNNDLAATNKTGTDYIYYCHA